MTRHLRSRSIESNVSQWEGPNRMKIVFPTLIHVRIHTVVYMVQAFDRSKLVVLVPVGM